jgi:hypothetical protein
MLGAYSGRMARTYKVRPFEQTAAWSSDRRRYLEYVEHLLEELLPTAAGVLSAWPPGAPPALPISEMPPALHRLCRKRDRLSDSVMLFAAMAVEAFINFYGVYRLGEQQFNRHVERLPLERKVQLLLLVCDRIEVDKDDRLLMALKAVAERRNQLAHPKAKQVPRDQPAADRTGNPIPDTAQKQIQAMREFFTEFGRLVPRSRHVLPVDLTEDPTVLREEGAS